MPHLSSQRPSFAFCLTAAEGKSMTPKIQVHLILDLKKFDKKIKFKPTTNRPLTDPSQPFFRLGWCGTYSIGQPTDFHSIRRSGGILVLFCYRKRTRPSAAMSGKIINIPWILFLLKAKRNKSLFFPIRQPAHTNRTQKPKAQGLRFTEG